MDVPGDIDIPMPPAAPPAVGMRTIDAAAALRDMIVRGVLQPGARIVERTVCARIGVSRTPLREALKLLAQEGLVDLVPHCGARVTRLTPQDGRHLFAVLGALEALAAEAVARTMTPARLDHLEALHAAMLAQFHAGAREDYFATNTAIHDAIVAWCGNPVLRDSHRRLMLRALRGRFTAIGDVARWRQAVDEHEALMAALRRRDPDAAATVWRRHLENTGHSVVLALGTEATAPR